MTISRTGPIRNGRNRAGASSSGLTLVELIIVMTMLAIIMAISLPTLSRFFRGRNAQEEVRRFLALTRYARSMAVSQSLVMELWIDPENGTYGIHPQGAYDIDDDARTHQEFTVADGLTLSVDEEDIGEDGIATIVFRPDGSTDDESVESIIITEKDGNDILIAKTEYGLGYAVTDPDQQQTENENGSGTDTPWWQHEL